MSWADFIRDVQPHLHPLLGPYLDALQDAGQPPPVVKWVIQLPDGRECDGGMNLAICEEPKKPGKATRYTTREKAERTLRWCRRDAASQRWRALPGWRKRCEQHAALWASARVVPVLELPAALQ